MLQTPASYDGGEIVLCPNCRQQIDGTAIFCSNCGQRIAPDPATASENARPMTATLIMIVGIGVVVVILVFSRNQRSTGLIQTSESSTSSRINTSIQPNRNALTAVNVQEAIVRLTANLRVGGSILVEGIQELPQESAARADLRFDSFQYKSDQMGTPVSVDKQSPKKPDINSRNFYEEMYRYGTQQVRAKNYSGPGYAVLKHYSDGRWVLKEVHWELNGWAGTVEIR